MKMIISELDADFRLSRILSVPLGFLLLRVKNFREAEGILSMSSSANAFDMLHSKYATLDLQRKSLQKAWEALWRAHDPFLLPAATLIAEQVSALDRARLLLLRRMDSETKHLQVTADALQLAADMNSSFAEELRSEGVTELATLKCQLMAVEQELVARVRNFSAGSSLESYRPMADHIGASGSPA